MGAAQHLLRRKSFPSLQDRALVFRGGSDVDLVSVDSAPDTAAVVVPLSPHLHVLSRSFDEPVARQLPLVTSVARRA